MPSADTPFVLLDDARPGGAQTLYRDAVEIVRADCAADVEPALERLRAALASGHHVAGYMSYEAGHALGPALAPLLRRAMPDAPLLWFGLFDRAEILSPAALAAELGDPAGTWAGPVVPDMSRADYDAAHSRVQALIAAGDVYQVNLSFRARAAVRGSPRALYARLRGSAGAGWGGIVHDGSRWLLSLSPELFFRSDGATIETRPMKGTASRGRTLAGDAANAARLAADPKERAENLMIVDLLRNDLSRVAVPGSVTVPEMFAVETYPTVLQMVSRIDARLSPGGDAVDIVRALFPCGSVTGAPKHRAMEVIAEVEASARGIYTGAIGAFAPGGAAAFNVAIRTLVLDEGADEARMGIGSAVVADSTADGEWRECLAKAAFVTAGQQPFDLIETMRFDPDEGVFALERHLARLGASAAAFGFILDRHALRNELHTATFRLEESARLRLRLSPGGAIAIETARLPPAPDRPVEVAVVPLPVDPSDFRLRHKTSDRAFYDIARLEAGTFEVLFARPDGLLTEGSFTSLFARRGGRLVTPPAARALLPGILRESLIERGAAVEGDLTALDLTDGFLIGNALRGLIPARLRRD